MKQFNNSSGFTLLELMVVFSIMAILASLGFASYVSYSRKQVVDQAAYDMKTGIDAARYDAVSRVTPTNALYPASCAVERYRFRACTNVSGAGYSSVYCSPGSNNLYEIDPSCVNGINTTYPLQDNPVAFKVKASSNLNISIGSSDCGTTQGVINFYVIGGVTDNQTCRIVLSAKNGPSYSRTICIDNTGNASIKPGGSTPASCP